MQKGIQALAHETLLLADGLHAALFGFKAVGSIGQRELDWLEAKAVTLYVKILELEYFIKESEK